MLDEDIVMQKDDWVLHLKLERALQEERFGEAKRMYFDTKDNIARRMAKTSLRKRGIEFPLGFDFARVKAYKDAHEAKDSELPDKIYDEADYETRRVIDDLFLDNSPDQR